MYLEAENIEIFLPFAKTGNQDQRKIGNYEQGTKVVIHIKVMRLRWFGHSVMGGEHKDRSGKPGGR